MPWAGVIPRPTRNKKAKAAAHKSEASSALQEFVATFMSSSTILKEKMHEANTERWGMYYTMQGQNMKEMQEARG